MHATDSGTAELITPSPAKILFFTPYWSALPQRNEIINSVLIPLSFERPVIQGHIIFQQSSIMYMQWSKNPASQKQTFHVEATADLHVHVAQHCRWSHMWFTLLMWTNQFVSANELFMLVWTIAWGYLKVVSFSSRRHVCKYFCSLFLLCSYNLLQHARAQT